ncbi:hypothetical protein QAD02_017483 [Eretmocerus hayati]|uniref:Uncharacterized protein n=1 Tax=Eretmocerus hayati TaxID=131215 RepID=A0ACC2PF97_9HYME|nr:hypothetical protein QAD02_017483 [Eretmocerus hayati]
MALRELVEGECGGPNPLIRLTSHFVKDHGLKEEGVRRELFGSVGPIDPATSPDQLVKQFLEESNAQHPQTFKMENLLQEMRDIDRGHFAAPVMAPGVAEELANQDTAWANQYLQSGRNFQENHTDDIWNAQPGVSNVRTGFPGETFELGLGPKWAEEYLEQSIDQSESSTSKPENPDQSYSKFMKFMRQEGDVPAENTHTVKSNSIDSKWISEFTEVSDNTVSADSKVAEPIVETNILSAIDEQSAVAGSWVDEFTKNNTKEDAENFESTFWKRLESEWDKVSSEELSTNHPWVSEMENYYDPFKEYSFNEENPMTNLSNPLEEGKRRLESGDLPGAVLCFEAAAKQDPQNPEAWLLLGKTQAENEQDPMAISALKQCLTIDPRNLEALMALAVCYTNESYVKQACLTLKDWLIKNEKYQHLAPSESLSPPAAPDVAVSTVLFDNIHSQVKDLYILAARMQPSGTIDADVQCGLGVLFNLSNEYDKAADCFRAALQVRPKDPMLWNRLGAILANGQRSEEAIEAYHQALELSPGFIRARYNLGISCINLNAYKEAGEHLLTALNQQAAGKGATGERAPTRVMSDSIWSTLRLVVSLMHRYDLTEAIQKRDLMRLNKEFEIE